MPSLPPLVGPLHLDGGLDRPADHLIAAVAAAQHGRVAAWQLVALGVTRRQVDTRVAAGRLHREFRGVYAVGHPGGSADARRMAAVLACGPRAVLSHRSLAHHLGLLDGDGPWAIDVTVAGRTRAGQAGIRLHLLRVLRRSEATALRGIPCTTVERLLADLAAAATEAELATLVHRAQVRGLLRPAAMAEQLARPAAGVGRLRALVEPTGPDLRAELERRFHALVRPGPWPAYQANVLLRTPLGPLRLDAHWPGHGFGVELDSWRHHGDREAFERDRERVRAADATGIDVKRVTWRMVAAQPHPVRALLDRRLG